MIFNEVVQNAVEQTKGAIASVIMGTDGIPLATYLSPQSAIELEVMGVEYSSLLNEVRRVCEILEAGELQEITVSTDKFIVVIRSLNKEYFLALILGVDGNVGKGRFYLRVKSPAIRKELY